MSAFEISRIEIVALRKLELVSRVLATKLEGMASREQQCLADTLGDVLDRYEIDSSRPKKSVPPPPEPTTIRKGGVSL